MNKLINWLVSISAVVQARKILILFNKEGKFGYVNHQGAIVLSPIVLMSIPISWFFLIVSDPKWYAVIENGEIIIEPYDEIDAFSGFITLTECEGKSKTFYGLIGQRV